MKKLITLAIAAIMLLAAIIPAGAAETEKPVIGYSETLIEKISDDKIAALTDIKSFSVDDVKTEYKITDAEGLVKFADLVADAKTTDETTGKVTGHNFKDVTVYLVADIDVSTNADFHPIGNNGSNAAKTTPFRGTFDGQGHTIKVSINGSYSNGCGLFSGINTAVLKNFILEGKVVSNNNSTGGIVGWIQTSTISNVLNRAMVAATSKRFIGGIAADIINNDADNLTEGAYNTIVNVTNEGNITAQGQVGGFVGRIYAKETKNYISKCINYGTIRGTVETANMADKNGGTAGIVGNVYNGSVDISECYNFGDITATKQVGAAGIIGILRTEGNSVATVKNCFNKGEITCVAVDEAGKAYEELVGAYVKENAIITSDGVTISPILTVVQEASYTYDASLEPKADEPVVPPTSGDTDNKDDEQNKPDDTDKKDDDNTAATDKNDENAASTDKPGTTNTSNNTEPAEEKGGCGGAIMGTGMVLMAVCACGCAVVYKTRR